MAPCSAFKILKKEQGGLGPLRFSRILGGVLRHAIGEASGQWNRLAVAPPAGKMGSAPFQENPEIPGGVPPPWRGSAHIKTARNQAQTLLRMASFWASMVGWGARGL